ncbi:unnamed protein product [Clonostachys rosea]|uniref:Uncharacterized protein n=1 Tax=Bionectria ochroleuca TaxID=29856 RepID=A0ABY6UDC2_BIOOC|nr:unnamed protein product [Clonostachys rosea]
MTQGLKLFGFSSKPQFTTAGSGAAEELAATVELDVVEMTETSVELGVVETMGASELGVVEGSCVVEGIGVSEEMGVVEGSCVAEELGVVEDSCVVEGTGVSEETGVVEGSCAAEELGVSEETGVVEDSCVAEGSDVTEELGVSEELGVVEDSTTIEVSDGVEGSGVAEKLGVVSDSAYVEELGVVIGVSRSCEKLGVKEDSGVGVTSEDGGLVLHLFFASPGVRMLNTPSKERNVRECILNCGCEGVASELE